MSNVLRDALVVSACIVVIGCGLRFIYLSGRYSNLLDWIEDELLKRRNTR